MFPIRKASTINSIIVILFCIQVLFIKNPTVTSLILMNITENVSLYQTNVVREAL